MLELHEVVELLLPERKLGSKAAVVGRVVGWREQRQHEWLGRAAKDAVKRVIVSGRNRVVLVIVAAGARDRQSHQPARHHVDPVVDDVVNVPHEVRTDRQEPQRGKLRRSHFCSVSPLCPTRRVTARVTIVIQ